MAKIPARKIHSADPGKFTETVEFEVLHCGNVVGNNNKFYCAELQRDPSTGAFQIFTHYGRIGNTAVYDVRNTVDGSPMEETSARKEYSRLLKKKKAGKKIKSDDGVRIEKYEAVEVVSPSIGSDNIRRKATKTSISSKSKTPFHDDAQVDTLLRQLISENVHHITSVTGIQLGASGALETPLGPVTSSQIDKARDVLNGLNAMLKSSSLSASDSEVSDRNTAYFSLIPHALGAKIRQSDWILDGSKLAEEFTLLDQLESALTVQSDSDDTSFLKSIGLSLGEIKDKAVVSEVSKQVERTRSHHHRNCHDWKVKRVYEASLSSADQRFSSAEAELGNTVDLFHGSRNSNILSILTHGLIVPPVQASHVTGRMFGDGIYAASASTKALNYSVGYWGGVANKFSNSFLFIVRFAMGKTFSTTSSRPQGAPRGYNSVHAKAGSSLLNDEYIVYSTRQAKITHLVELSK